MSELQPGWSPCPAQPCPTHVQGGSDGMLGHLQLIHHPDLTREQLEEKYSAQLWPEIADAGG